METTYSIRALDGKEYGPVTLNDLIAWIREGRVNAQTEIRRSDMDYWSSAASFTELTSFFAATPPPPAFTTNSVGGENAQLAARLRSSASWFYWIAGLSLINSICAVAGTGWRFIFGLGITQVIDEFGAHFGGGAVAATLILDVIAAGLFVLFGVFAHKRQLWAFIVGGVLFLFDSLLILLAQDWLSVAFHAFVVFSLFLGTKACHQLNSR